LKSTLKHRLVGAAVLAAVAILFLPSFFKEKQMASVSKKTQIPARPGIVAVEFNAPKPVLDIEPAPAPETMFVPEDGVPPEALNDSNTDSNTESNTESNTDSNTKIAQSTISSLNSSSDAAAMPLNAQGLPDAWVVQVGSFSTKEAAIKLRDELQVEGFKAYVRTIPNGNSSVSRVFIGPKLDKSQAQLIKAQVDKRLKVNSILTRFKP
jgi:DedD protein